MKLYRIDYTTVKSGNERGKVVQCAAFSEKKIGGGRNLMELEHYVYEMHFL